MDQAEATRLEQQINREVIARFPVGAIERVALVRDHEDPLLEPGELLIRVYAAAPDGALDDWAQEHQVGMRRLRRELSLRLPPARLLEFTVAGPGADRITLADDPAVADEPVPVTESVPMMAGMLRTNYVFPDQGAAAAESLEASLAAGEYDGLDDEALAGRLTSQLYEVCHDRHLRVRVTPGPPRRGGPGRGRGGLPVGWPPLPGWLEKHGPHSYGIHRVERLDGDVGYLDLHGVAPPEDGGRAIAAAMELVAGTGALIVDLRQNHGGSPDGVVFWLSYLFPDADTHLNDIFDAGTGQTKQFWTLAHLPGDRYLDRPVYVLTSKETFSGGEDFAYSLQAQGRAEVIGETTGGGAHPTSGHPVTPTLALLIPHARSVNPVTGTNWEGTGVTPDLAVPADEAFDVAYGKALRHLLTQELPPPFLDEARKALAALEGEGS
jgi:Peptidase family S41/N-terminal domain of Peptidase_S41 in eukaryotic IRBP